MQKHRARPLDGFGFMIDATRHKLRLCVKAAPHHQENRIKLSPENRIRKAQDHIDTLISLPDFNGH